VRHTSTGARRWADDKTIVRCRLLLLRAMLMMKMTMMTMLLLLLMMMMIPVLWQMPRRRAGDHSAVARQGPPAPAGRHLGVGGQDDRAGRRAHGVQRAEVHGPFLGYGILWVRFVFDQGLSWLCIHLAWARASMGVS
jgi:hypothetical protein